MTPQALPEISITWDVQAYNRWKAADEDAAPTEVGLLTEIRDSLRDR